MIGEILQGDSFERLEYSIFNFNAQYLVMNIVI